MKYNMKKVNDLKEGDYIAFKWEYGVNQGEGGDIVVTDITKVYDDQVLVHFLDGYKSESEFVKKEDILAIGNMDGNDGIKGWTGKFDILKPDHPLIVKNLK